MADEQVGDERRLQGEELLGERRRVGEIEHPGATRRDCDQEPAQMGRAFAPQRFRRPGMLVEAEPLIAVALPEALDRDHQVGPHRLRAGVAAPDAAGDRGDEEQRQRREHQQAGDEVEFLRPDLEEEEIEAPRGKIDEHRLVGQIGSAIPADPRHDVVDAERHRHHDPFHRAEAAVGLLGIDLDPRGIEAVAVVAWGRAGEPGSAASARAHRRRSWRD